MRMRSVVLHAVDSHTEGMPTRVITGGIGTIPGATMGERRLYFREHRDDIRQLLMYEPRGHSAMSGAILQPPTRPDGDCGVVYIEVSGYLPMCGHGTIGVATVLVETGMVEVVEPVTTVRLDTPAGLVVAEVRGRGRRGHRRDPEQRALLLRRPRPQGHARRRPHGHLRPRLRRQLLRDPAPGGAGTALRPRPQGRHPRGGPGHDGRRSTPDGAPVHPEDPSIRGCHHVHLVAPGSDARRSRHAMAIHPGWFDRSPCGTGTSARMAQLHARGELPLGTEFVNESFIGTRFTGRLLGTTGSPASPPSCRAHRARLDHRHRPVPPRPRGPVPGGVRAVGGVDNVR